MSDIAFIGESSFLYQKLFAESGVSYQFVSADLLGSPFLPRFKVIIIPTGFANPLYSKALSGLKRASSRVAEFVRAGGILTVFGPMVAEHRYDWLPLPLEYVCELGSRSIGPSSHECTCILCTSTPECDGSLIPGQGFETILEDEKGRAILVAGELGQGLILATSVHEFPSVKFMRWAASRAKEAKL